MTRGRKAKNLVGLPDFGLLRPLRRDESSIGKRAKWICECQGCNRIISVMASHLLSGNSTACKWCGYDKQRLGNECRRTRQLHLVVTSEDYDAICAAAKKDGIGISGIVRRALARDGIIKPKEQV